MFIITFPGKSLVLFLFNGPNPRFRQKVFPISWFWICYEPVDTPHLGLSDPLLQSALATGNGEISQI